MSKATKGMRHALLAPHNFLGDAQLSWEDAQEIGKTCVARTVFLDVTPHDANGCAEQGHTAHLALHQFKSVGFGLAEMVFQIN